MKKLVAMLMLAASVAAANAGDIGQTMVCEGEVVAASAVFQKINGTNAKLYVENRVGNCPFADGPIKQEILKTCQIDGKCKVKAIVGPRRNESGVWINAIISVGRSE